TTSAIILLLYLLPDSSFLFFFFFNATATTAIYTLSLHDALPIFDPLQGRTQLRPVEVAVVVDPALNVRVVGLSQILQGFVAVMMKGPAPDRPADGRQRLRAGCRHEAVRGAPSPHRLPRSKHETEKVERLAREVAAPIRI